MRSKAPSPDPAFDARMMRRALRLARRGQGRVEPNPMVGCILVRDGRIIAEGWHRRFGGPHAEAAALNAAGEGGAAGATAYVTLEPCCHFGKTPPCADALIRAGVRRVVAGTEDPNPLVVGGGFHRLREAGIEVVAGVEGAAAKELIAPFTTRIRRGRPYVIAKWAQSLDGKLAAASGDSKWISCEASRRRVHRLRARVDAIIVGVGTVLADDPLLTARDVPVRRVAARVVLDARLRTVLSSALVRSAGAAPLIIMTSAAAAARPAAHKLAWHGVRVVSCRSRRGLIDPADVLARLAEDGATNVLVEGGAAVLTSFLSAGLVDEAHVYVAPLLIPDSRGAVIGSARFRSRAAFPARGQRSGFMTIAQALRPDSIRWRRIGTDVCAQLRFQHEA